MAASPTSFLVQWWFSPNTNLGIYFNSFGVGAETNPLTITNGANGPRGLNFDNGMGCSVQESYRFENQITNHPVEKTTAISDHIIIQPIRITVTGIISSFKILSPSNLSTISLNPASLLETLSRVSFSQLGNATKILTDMAQINTGLTLVTGLLYGTQYARFDNLAVESLDLPRTNEYGRSSIKFTITFKQLIITNSNSQVTPRGFSKGILDPTAVL